MKKLFTSIHLILLSVLSINAQGLENIIVEKYYISDANDATVNSMGGVLPVGSVTYRVYVDMLPDYIFQSAYGDPSHELRIETSTLFFNNEDRGSIHPTFSSNYCKNNTVMLDSWLSVGAAANGKFGVLKSADDGVATVANVDGVLLNNDPLMGIPLTQQDGLLTGTPEPVLTVGIGNEITMFDSQNDGTNGPIFSTFNGAWASINGSSGPDPLTNQVLIMQITTDGTFSFSLNLQIRNQTTLAVENYVATSASGNEILFPALNYNSSSSSVADIPSDILSLEIFPVPASDFLNFQILSEAKNSNYQYKIFNMLGKEVIRKNIGNISGSFNSGIDISNLNSGIYFLELASDSSTIAKKFVKN